MVEQILRSRRTGAQLGRRGLKLWGISMRLPLVFGDLSADAPIPPGHSVRDPSHSSSSSQEEVAYFLRRACPKRKEAA